MFGRKDENFVRLKRNSVIEPNRNKLFQTKSAQNPFKQNLLPLGELKNYQSKKHPVNIIVTSFSKKVHETYTDILVKSKKEHSEMNKVSKALNRDI